MKTFLLLPPHENFSIFYLVEKYSSGSSLHPEGCQNFFFGSGGPI